jgi:hypothetical protein
MSSTLSTFISTAVLYALDDFGIDSGRFGKGSMKLIRRVASPNKVDTHSGPCLGPKSGLAQKPFTFFQTPRSYTRSSQRIGNTAPCEDVGPPNGCWKRWRKLSSLRFKCLAASGGENMLSGTHTYRARPLVFLGSVWL